MKCSDGITDSMGMGLSRLYVLLMNGEAWQAATHGVRKSWAGLIDLTEFTVLT